MRERLMYPKRNGRSNISNWVYKGWSEGQVVMGVFKRGGEQKVADRFARWKVIIKNKKE